MTDSLLRPRPSIVMVMFFGWLFLLIRGAFAMRTYLCGDCGANNRYKSAGSWVALAVLGVLVFCVVVAVMDQSYHP